MLSREALVFALANSVLLVIDRMRRVAYVQFDKGEAMVNVIAAVESADQHDVVFDVLDEDLWEHRAAEVRLHGMFKEDLM